MDEKALESTSNDATQLEQLLEQLNTNQKRFIIARQEYTTDKEAALSIGLSPDTIKNWKYAGVPIDVVVDLMAHDGVVMALHLRRMALAKAMAIKVAGLDEDDSRLRQSVATEIVEWEIGKATQRQEISGLLKSLDLSTLTDSQLDRLAKGEDVISVLTSPGSG